MADRIRCVSVIGASACSAEEAAIAERLGVLLAQAGFAIVCGGGTGVMEAVCRGAQGVGGMTIGILPGMIPAEANPYVQIAIPTGLTQVRNALVVLSGEVVIAVGGGYGTLSEIGFAKKHGKPLIGIGTWQLQKADGSVADISRVQTPEEAVQLTVRLVDAAG